MGITYPFNLWVEIRYLHNPQSKENQFNLILAILATYRISITI